jgi:hypothetical protein
MMATTLPEPDLAAENERLWAALHTEGHEMRALLVEREERRPRC